MTIDTPTPAADLEPVISTRDLLAQYGIVDSIAKAYGAQAGKLKKILEERALDAFRTNGTVSHEVTAAGVKLGNFTVPTSEAAVIITDLKALTAWAEQHFPEHVHYVPTLDDAFRQELLHKMADKNYETGIVTWVKLDQANGTFEEHVIPGVHAAKGGLPQTPKLAGVTAKRREQVLTQLMEQSRLVTEFNRVDELADAAHQVIDGEVVSEETDSE